MRQVGASARSVVSDRPARLDLIAMRKRADLESGLAEMGPSEIETLHALTGEDDAVVDLAIPTLTILFHPDAQRIGELVRLHELPASRPVALSRLAPAFAADGDTAERRPLADPHLSRQPILLRRDPSDPDAVVIERATSRARVDIDGTRLESAQPVGPAALARGVVLTLGRRVVLLLHHHYARLCSPPSFGLIGESTPMIRLRHEIKATAGLDASVLLRGETGTGKELVARAVHAASPRRARPFVSVNLAAIPASLAASELFGAARGAYTGADRQKDGFFARAAGGTLFLDEIGETPPEIQPLLLRALEDGEIQPVGSRETERVDVRVIAATDADLEAAIASEQFRSPLLHRLAGFEIRLPPLRRRPGDFGRLFFHFLHQALHELGGGELARTPPTEARPWPPVDWIARLARYPWPGNVRQLRNIARRLAVAQCNEAPMLRLATLEELLGSSDTAPSEGARAAASQAAPAIEASEEHACSVPNADDADEPVSAPGASGVRRAADISEDELLRALEQHGYERKRAADALGISRGALYYLIEQCPQIRQAGDLEAGDIAPVVEEAGGDLLVAAATLGVSRQALKRRMRALGLR